MQKQDSVTIIGAGTMGHALAVVFARAHYKVNLYDNDKNTLNKCKMLLDSAINTIKDDSDSNFDKNEINENISIISNLKDAVKKSDIIIEAIIEEINAKKTLYNELIEYISDTAIVASNTSYLDVFSIAPEKLKKRFIITHFFNPPYIIPLVEVVGSPLIEKTLIDKIIAILKNCDMIPILMKKYIGGYIVNRIQRAIGREVFNLIDNGFADPHEIDTAVKASLGIRIPVLGVVKRYDHAGLDMTIRALKAPSIKLVNEDKIPNRVAKLAEHGYLGIKTGKGFYDYGDKPLESIIKERDAKLVQVKKLLKDLSEI